MQWMKLSGLDGEHRNWDGIQVGWDGHNSRCCRMGMEGWGWMLDGGGWRGWWMEADGADEMEKNLDGCWPARWMETWGCG